MDTRGQFTFYRSFWEAAQGLPKKDRLPILEAIITYALDGEEPKGLSQTQSAFFLLCRPTLDASRKKAANGKQGGQKPKANGKQKESKTEANGKQTASEKEREIEKENEIEIEGEEEEEKENESKTPAPEEANSTLADVMSTYMDKINASPSPTVVAELQAYTESLSAEVVLHALHIAIDERKLSWSYIQAILRRYKAEGLCSLALVQAAEAERQERRDAERKAASEPRGNKVTGSASYTPMAQDQLKSLIERM